MGVKVKIDLSGIKGKYSSERIRRAQKLALNDAFQAMDKYVPYREGNLSKQASMSLDGKSIIYTMPYAKAQFYGLVGSKPGYPVHNYTTTVHPQASKRWDLKVTGDKGAMNGIKNAFIKGLEK